MEIRAVNSTQHVTLHTQHIQSPSTKYYSIVSISRFVPAQWSKHINHQKYMCHEPPLVFIVVVFHIFLSSLCLCGSWAGASIRLGIWWWVINTQRSWWQRRNGMARSATTTPREQISKYQTAFTACARQYIFTRRNNKQIWMNNFIAG